MVCLLGYIQIYLKLRKYYNFGAKSSRRAWHVIPAQKVNPIASYGTLNIEKRRFKEREREREREREKKMKLKRSMVDNRVPGDGRMRSKYRLGTTWYISRMGSSRVPSITRTMSTCRDCQFVKLRTTSIFVYVRPPSATGSCPFLPRLFHGEH